MAEEVQREKDHPSPSQVNWLTTFIICQYRENNESGLKMLVLGRLAVSNVVPNRLTKSISVKNMFEHDVPLSR